MNNKDKAYKTISALVDRFGEQIDSYKKSDYNETQTRRDFIDPFFKSLGWDMDNENGYAESYREVIHEDKIKIGSATKAPDYSFRLVGGKRLFFVEAKKPSVGVKENMDPAYQVRRYAWSAKLPISIVTDFEEFAIYDCTKKPLITDKASVSRIQYLTFQDYLKEFDLIWETFSKEQVLKGSFDKFVKGSSNKKGTTTVDKEFLESLDSWRTYLATSISWNNKDLNVDEINYAVQLTIDRLIFLRIAEDRSVEPYGNLQLSIKQGDFYQNLFQQFQQADDKYNSGLFDFKKDKISQALIVDNKVLKTIINELYYPESPYEFSVLSVEILGSAYEQFLGKTITIDKAHRAKIEEKPEVRKAGGVYYTPEYIVEYIVKNTVGKLIENKTPKEIEKIKILDPACGSGSFLIGAYQYLLDWHKNYYTDNGKASKGGKNNPLTPEGNLTTSEKKRILINNIFGVDIDLNACEVTKLSLLLKCMEGETEASISSQFKLFNERVLPTLESNIKCGNSLIDLDFYDNQLDFGEEKKINAFNWKKAFPAAFNQGGFDAVIGNPPYLRMQGMKETQSYALDYYKNNYVTASSGNFDLYVLFDEKGLSLLNDNGEMGFIQPHKFFQADFGVGLRNLISSTRSLVEVINFGSEQVFDDATTYCCLLFLNKKKSEKVKVTNVNDLEQFSSDSSSFSPFYCTQPEIDTNWNFVSASQQSLFDKLYKQPQTLGDITRKIFVGLQTSADKIYVLEQLKENKDSYLAYSKALDTEVEIEKGIVKPFLMGKDVKRYEPLNPHNLVIFPYQLDDGSANLMSVDNIKSKFPLAWDYISKNKKELEGRENGKMKGNNFYAYIYPKNLSEFASVKICTPEIAIKPQLTMDTKGTCYHTTKVYSFAFKSGIKENEKYFLGILNSPILWYFLSLTGYVLRGGYFAFKTAYLKPFPVKLINFKSTIEVELHDKIILHVDQLLNLHLEIKQTKLESKVNEIESKIEYTENKINQIVYQLYNLTSDEIKIVEGQN